MLTRGAESSPQNSSKQSGMVSHTCDLSIGEVETSACWPARLDQSMSFRPMTDVVSKEVNSVSKEDTRGFPVTCTYVHACTHNTHTYMSFVFN